MQRLFFSAPFILAFLFFLVTLISNILGVYFPYSADYYEYLVGAIFTFSFFYLLARFIRLPHLVIFKYPVFTDKQILRCYLYFMIIGVFLNMLNHILIVGYDFYTPEKINAYRYYLTVELGASPIPFLAFFNFFFFTLIPLLIFKQSKVTKKYTVWSLILLFFFIYLSSSRSVLYFIALLSFYYYFCFKKINLKRALQMLVVFGLLIIGFIVIGSLAGKAVTNNFMFLNYLLGGSHALDQILHYNYTLRSIFLSFRPLDSILQYLGLIQVEASLLPYFNTPFKTNVYTMFGVYVLDYGVIGSLFFMAFFGFMSGYIEQILHRFPGNSYLRLLFALNLTILTLAVFYDYYLSSGITWMIVLLGLVFF